MGPRLRGSTTLPYSTLHYGARRTMDGVFGLLANSTRLLRAKRPLGRRIRGRRQCSGRPERDGGHEFLPRPRTKSPRKFHITHTRPPHSASESGPFSSSSSCIPCSHRSRPAQHDSVLRASTSRAVTAVRGRKLPAEWLLRSVEPRMRSSPTVNTMP